jgi:hypothetical protein
MDHSLHFTESEKRDAKSKSEHRERAYIAASHRRVLLSTLFM